MDIASICATCVLVTVYWIAVEGLMDPQDVSVLTDFQANIQNSDKLGWKSGQDPCTWPGINCAGSFVSSISLANMELGGTLTPSLNQLTSLTSLSLQGNGLTGALPSLNGLSNLQTCYLDHNNFDTIPATFFHGLTSLQFLYLTDNPNLNTSSGGWSLSLDLLSSTLLTNLSLTNTSLIGQIPDFLGSLSSLNVLYLAYNKLGGGIPSSFLSSNLQQLQANNQLGPRLSGTLDVIGSMQSLTLLWLHENEFTGVIPPSLVNAISLKNLKLNGNELVGPIPPGYADLPLSVFSVENNMLDGPIPLFNGTFTFSNNFFCIEEIGASCASQVTALLVFLGSVNYPSRIVRSWKGNDPCTSWTGITCDANGNVVVVNLANNNLSGVITSSISQLAFLTTLKLNNNNLTGTIPSSLGSMQFLKSLDVSNNNLMGPMPTFPSNVVVDTSGNPLINIVVAPPHSSSAAGPGSSTGGGQLKSASRIRRIAVVTVVVIAVVSLLAVLAFCILHRKKGCQKSARSEGSMNLAIRPQNSSENAQISNKSGFEADNLAISLSVLREATKDFSDESFLGSGGFGSVYKGQLKDGTVVAVKRMESAMLSNKGLKEFQAEIAVWGKVRHRHLVALLGFCVEGNERLIVYEYMPKGTLNQHLFECSEHNIQPLGWKTRLCIARDVARGLEYLHGLAQSNFIHRDLKPSNILLNDHLEAKISDFGLVKLVPEGGKQSVETRVAGTFGYLAPEYAVNGRVTTKSDVYSFGVVLMNLITGRHALENTQFEDGFQLVPWFRRMYRAHQIAEVVDRNIHAADHFAESIHIVAELADHCTSRDPQQRPDMSHAVNVLVPLVRKWTPSNANDDDDQIGVFTAEEARKKLLALMV